MQDDFLVYSKQVIANAKAMEMAFKAKNYDIVSGGTDNHLLLIDLRNKNLSGKKAENTLVKADITINKNMVPFDDKSPFITSGIRVGLPALTTRGLNESHMGQIVDWMDSIMMDTDNETKISHVKHEINEFMSQFPLYPNWKI
jgi:glycine hydroxymethyltransferase